MLLLNSDKNCPKAYGGENCKEELIAQFKGKYCGTLTEGGAEPAHCFTVTETSQISIFDIDVNIKAAFSGDHNSFEILEKDINPIKLTGGNGSFEDNNLTFTLNYKVLENSTSSSFKGTK